MLTRIRDALVIAALSLWLARQILVRSRHLVWHRDQADRSRGTLGQADSQLARALEQLEVVIGS